MMDFLYMGGYAAYVWPAYGIVAVVLAANVVLPLRRERRLRRIVSRGKKQ